MTLRRDKLQRLEWGAELDPENLPHDEIEFLRRLGGPTLIAVRGRDASRTRVVTTLLHGNEPSGLRAMHRWLHGGVQPATNTIFFVACVDTALTEPTFSHRHLPDRRDFNRCFDRPPIDPEGVLAAEVLSTLRAAEPECLVDLHNNTGHNPAYGVAVELGDADLSLVDLFADRVVHAPLALGTLVEATLDRCPSVTIECGRSGDPVADVVALTGLNALLTRDELDLHRPPTRPIRILEEPIRICIREGASLSFADSPDPDALLTISADIDRHNFERLPASSAIGWVKPGADWPLDAFRPDGTECSHEMFCLQGEVLETRFEFIPIMMTTKPEIARSDCLFYAAREGRRSE